MAPLLLILATLSTSAGPDPWTVRVTDHDGQPTALVREARNERLVVVVMKAASCPVCVSQLVELAQLKSRIRTLGARVVGLAVDPHSKLARLRSRTGLPWTLLSDPRHRLIDALKLWNDEWGHPVPSLVVFDKCGKEAARVEGRAPGERPEKALLALLEAMAKNPRRCSQPTSG